MGATLYLFRHGLVIKGDYDKLNPEGEKFKDWLPRFFQNRRTKLDAAYYDGSDDIKRCLATLASIECTKEGYGTGGDKKHKTLNSVLGDIVNGVYAICCRGDSIESGQLYHVRDFEPHTGFPSQGNHGELAKKKTREAYHVVYVLELKDGVWHQIEKCPLPLDALTE
jgi:hypothetical protein